jgi:hypothetical protein
MQGDDGVHVIRGTTEGMRRESRRRAFSARSSRSSRSFSSTKSGRRSSVDHTRCSRFETMDRCDMRRVCRPRCRSVASSRTPPEPSEPGPLRGLATQPQPVSLPRAWSPGFSDGPPALTTAQPRRRPRPVRLRRPRPAPL